MLRNKKTQALYDYWRIIAEGKLAPFRSDIQPSDIRSLLGDTFILQTDEQYEEISFRLAGTRVCTLFGVEMRGKNFLQYWTRIDKQILRFGAKECCRNYIPHVMTLLGRTSSGNTVELEMLFLPLYSDNTEDIRIFGMIDPVNSPMWLGVEQVSMLELNEIDTLPSNLEEEDAFNHSSHQNTVPFTGESLPKRPRCPANACGT